MRIHNEYQFVKKRALMNYLTNSRLTLEKSFHDRTLTMLSSISKFESSNMQTLLKDVTQKAFSDTMTQLESNPRETRN